MSLNMFGSPASYIQGSDVLFKSAEYLARLGNRILLLAGPTSLRIAGNEFGDYLINTLPRFSSMANHPKMRSSASLKSAMTTMSKW